MALLNSVPGDIPGLLRRGSPVLHGGLATVVMSTTDHTIACIGTATGLWGVMPDSLRLDLTDATGRAHAAWWAFALRRQHPHLKIGYGEEAVAMTAILGDEMTPEQIDTLARLVLRLAGRTP